MIEDYEYKKFSDFKRWVLLPAQKELNEKTDIYFVWSEEREGQVCVAIEFVIQSQDRKICQEVEVLVKSNQLADIGKREETIGQLVNIGVTKRTAQRIVKEYDEQRIRAAIALTESQQKLGKVSNPGGFLVEAIKNEYRDSKAEEKQRRQKAKKAGEEKERQEKQRKVDQASQNKQAVEGYLSSLTQEQRTELEAEFVEAYKDNPLLMQRYNKQGLKSVMVKGCFDDFVLKRLSQLTEANA
jgi:plasmid replication initiation protein